MGVAYTCMKWLFIIINTIFLIFAVAGIGISIWMFVDPKIPLQFTQEQNDYLISTVIFLIASIVLLLVAVLGIYSVSREVRKALVVSFCLLLIIVVAEIAAGVWGYIQRDSLEAHIKAAVKNTVKNDYDRDVNVRTLFDTIQEKMECCGAERPADWTRGQDINLIISKPPLTYDIPTSCCRSTADKKQCQDATRALRVGVDPDTRAIYDKGCYDLIKAKLADSVCCILIVGGVVLVSQLLGLILGLILACSMNRAHRYKA